MVFLPGNHALDTNITVTNVVKLTMHGESSSGSRATVVCSGSVGLTFASMVEFKIDSLAFAFCSRYYPLSYFTLLLQSTQNAELVNCFFHDNLGTALVVKTNTSITLAGNEFTHNQYHCLQSSVCKGGGAVTALSSNLTFTGNTTFFDNNTTSVYGGGAIYASENAVLSFNGTINLISNSADGDGGAICASHCAVLNFNGNSNFINNSADSGSGGAIYASYNAVLSFNGNNDFVSNLASGPGGAIHASYNTVLNFNGTSNFINNSASYDGGGAICTNTNSKLLFNGTVYFTSNGHYGSGTDTPTTTYGGGVWIGLKCTFSILPNTTVYWENNHANIGGAIYVVDTSPLSYCASVAPYVPKEECFFHLTGQNLSSIDVQLVFKNNSADIAGSVLYGGAIDNCKLTHGLDSYSSREVFDMIVHIDNDTDYNLISNISSDPLQICPCENNLPDCNGSWYYNGYSFPCTVYPGETFQISVVAVGQRDGTVPSTVISIIHQGLYPGHLPDSQHLQQASNTCTKLNYTVFSLSPQVDIELHAEGSPCSVLVETNTTLGISVHLHQTCPPGFNLSESEKSCVCEPRLAQYTNNCTITNGVGRITRESGQYFWVGYENQSQPHGLILHPQCPFDYCINDTVVFPLNDTDKQCAYKRSGLLCGACKKGYSLVLGTSQAYCKQCTNIYLLLLIPFALMGVALVFLLLVCKLTVATGTLSGLLFYANIVGVNRTIFLPVESTDGFSIFIAWLNLDFGIETCFFDGMDAYSKTWLQFVFPLYIWMLVGLIVITHTDLQTCLATTQFLS